MSNDISQRLVEQVKAAHSSRSPLAIRGGGSRAFYGNPVTGDTLSTTGHTGIVEYQPSELVVTVRSGTLLSELENELAANRQMLAFEPPQHSPQSTIGGVIACGLSGPRRVACGAARDFLLGATIINGRGEKLRFGGQVMKNVAGYDAARLMAGAQGTLGVLLTVSLKVLPLSESEISLAIECELADAIKQLGQWRKQGLPLSASCYSNHTLTLRLSSTASAVASARQVIQRSFSAEESGNDFWLAIKNQQADFFRQAKNLWRCSHQGGTGFYTGTDNQLIEWHGALRWVDSSTPLHDMAAKHGGHATRYPLNQADAEDIFQPLPAALLQIHRNLKQAFDPAAILNPGRLYKGL